MGKKARAAEVKVSTEPGRDNPWGLLELPVKKLTVVCWGTMPGERERKAMAKRILKSAWLSPESEVEFIPVDKATMDSAPTKISKRGGVDGG